MIPKDLLEDYFIDQETDEEASYLVLEPGNAVEAMEQIDAEPFSELVLEAYRNGYKERSLKTRVGDLHLRSRSFAKSLPNEGFDRYSRVEKALINA